MSEPRCPFPHGDSGSPHADERWLESARRIADETARGRAAHSRVDAERAAAMAQHAVESRAERRAVERIDEAFVAQVGKKLGYGHPLSDRTGTLEFTWTPEAEERLRQVPAFCRELTRWRVEWTAHKHGLGSTITPEVMEAKYAMWGEVSEAIESRQGRTMPWTDDAVERLERIPGFVRGQVIQAVEGNAQRLGAGAVDTAIIDSTVERWTATGDFHEGRYGYR